jgi:hypothetical protein
MEVLFYVEGNVDGSDGEEKPCLILFHDLHKGSVLLGESHDSLEGKDTASSKICLRILTLKTQPHPLFA